AVLWQWKSKRTEDSWLVRATGWRPWLPLSTCGRLPCKRLWELALETTVGACLASDGGRQPAGVARPAGGVACKASSCKFGAWRSGGACFSILPLFLQASVMKQLFDYFPVIVFFGLYFYGGVDEKPDIMLATWGIIFACAVQVGLGWAIWRKVQQMHLMVFGFTLVFGGLTLFLNDEAFIKWRTSIIYFTLS